MSKDKHVVVVGLGNIGSHLVPQIGRMSRVGRVTVVDEDTFEGSNLPTQDIVPDDVGTPKAIAQARRLRMINPEIEVEAIVDSVENVPLGRLRSDVILAGLDSRLARQHVNEIAWAFHTSLIDAGVEGDGLLARVSVYLPGHDRSCHCCGWQDEDFKALGDEFSCTGKVNASRGDGATPATNAPSSLGALAASIQAIECQKILAGVGDDEPGYEILFDAAWHNLYKTRLIANPDCRSPVHGLDPVGEPERVSRETPVGDLFENGDFGGDADVSVAVLNHSFVTELRCTRCDHRRPFLMLEPSLKAGSGSKCRKCGGEMIADSFDLEERLYASDLPARTRAPARTSFPRSRPVRPC